MSDLIKRSDVIKVVCTVDCGIMTERCEELTLGRHCKVYNALSALPSVESKTGKWVSETRCHKSEDGHEYMYIVEHCSECGARRHIGWQDVNYCPNCGVKMEV